MPKLEEFVDCGALTLPPKGYEFDEFLAWLLKSGNLEVEFEDGAPNVGVADVVVCGFDEGKLFEPNPVLDCADAADPKLEKPLVEGCEAVGFENGFEPVGGAEFLLLEPKGEEAPNTDVTELPRVEPALDSDIVLNGLFCVAEEGFDKVPDFPFILLNAEFEVFRDCTCGSTDESLLVAGLPLAGDRGEGKRTFLSTACRLFFPSPLAVVPFEFSLLAAFRSRSSRKGSSSLAEDTKSAL